MKFPEENILDKWLDENLNPKIDKIVEEKLSIEVKNFNKLKEK